MSSSGLGPQPIPQGTLFSRKWNVTVANDTTALDLSQLHIQFSIEQSDVETPNNANIRIYNLSEQTSTRLLSKEFSRVVINAGYVNGPYGVIFDGSIKQSRRGRIDQTLTYLDILAADGDEAYNYGIVNQSLAAGSTINDQINAIAQGMGTDVGYVSQLQLGGNPQATIRGKVLFGLGKDYNRQIALANNSRWSIQNGKTVFIANSDYIQADPILVSAASGMVGIPEQTQDGISVTMLLNPKLKIGQPVQLSSKDINVAAFIDIPYGSIDASQLPNNQFPPLSTDGLYRVVVSEYEGDTRGNEWYSKLICFAVAPDVPASSGVNPWPS